MTCQSQFKPASAGNALIGEGEAIERQALRSLHEAATPDLRRDLGLDWCEGHSVTASVAAGLPQSAIVVNRAFLTRNTDLSTAAEPFRAADVARFFLHMPHGTSSPAENGFKEARAWQKFVRFQGAALPDVPALDIERVTPVSSAEAAARIVCAAFDLGTAAERWLARLCHDPRWRIFLARIDGVPAGTGALFFSNDAGWCDWGATAPAFRGRGVQLALLRHRLLAADALGLARVHTCTGAPAADDPQHSYRNILRSGFAKTILRCNLTPV